MSKVRKIVLLSLYMAVFVSMIFCVAKGVATSGIIYFRYFTTLSNIFCGIVLLVDFIYLIQDKPYTKALDRLNLMSVTSVTVTFLLVVVFLTPVTIYLGGHWYEMFYHEIFHLHFLNPVMAIISLIIYYSKQDINFKERLFGFIPVFLYSIVYVICVPVTNVWEDFYHFTFGGLNWVIPFSLIGMYLFSMGLTRLLTLLCKKF